MSLASVVVCVFFNCNYYCVEEKKVNYLIEYRSHFYHGFN